MDSTTDFLFDLISSNTETSIPIPIPIFLKVFLCKSGKCVVFPEKIGIMDITWMLIHDNGSTIQYYHKILNKMKKNDN